MNRKQRRACQSKGSVRTKQAASPMLHESLLHALRLCETGELDEAAACYGRVLALDPRHADAHNNLGVVLTRLGRVDAASASFRRALVIRPDFADAHNNIGTLLRSQGLPAEAAASFRRALALRPNHAEAHNNLGVALRELGRWEEAAAGFHRALTLRADYPDAHNNLGILQDDQGRLEEAAASFGRALALRPDYPEAHNNLGVTMRSQGRLDDAAACFQRALSLRADYAEALNNLGQIEGQAGRLDEAVACYERVIAINPRSPEAHSNLGIARMHQARWREAAACFVRALELAPENPETHNNLGIVHGEQGHYDQAFASLARAIALRASYAEAHNNLGVAQRSRRLLDDAAASYGRALVLKPTYAEAHNNLGVILMEQRRLADAVRSFEEALTHQPDYPDAHQNLAMALLAQGRYAVGWKEYEWRWKTPHMRSAARGFLQPQWHGEAADGRTLLIHAEQGFGDTLQFCRYVPLAVRCGLRVIVEAPTPLVRLLRECLPEVEAVVVQGEALPRFDCHCPMLSLPLALRSKDTESPTFSAYLHADRSRVALWRERLARSIGRGLRVALAWAGNPALAADVRRSLSPERLAPLLEVPGVKFVSLQKGGNPAPAHFRLFDPMAAVADFADTAALLANMDLIISVDSAVAHLGAGLGRPVWLLNRFDSCWRWPTDRRSSSWYPSMRLYHQPRPGDWDTVLAEIVGDLAALADTANVGSRRTRLG